MALSIMFGSMRTTSVVALVWLCFCLTPQLSHATHVVGGDISYRCLSNNYYEVTLTVRRDCFFGADDAPFDDPASVGIFDAYGNLLTYLGKFGQLLIPFIEDDTLNTVLTSDCGFIGSQVCVHQTVYRDTVFLPFLTDGYFLAYQRCCRNQTLNNIVDPLETGSTYFFRMTEAALQSCNSSAYFQQWPDIYVCANEPLVFDHSAIDIDGDSLVYSLCTPYTGATFDKPLPQPPNPPPYDTVVWSPGFDLSNVMGGVPLQIDPETGILTASPNVVGQYLIGVQVDEYRDGVWISRTKRDFEYNVRVCGEGPMASFTSADALCGDRTVSFENTSTLADSYEWFFDYPNEDPAFISSEASPTFTYPNFGTYTVKLIATRAIDGCQSTISKAISLFEGALIADFNVEVQACGSGGFTLLLSDQSIDENASYDIVSWSWIVETEAGITELTGNPATIDVADLDDILVTLTVTSSSGCMAEVERTLDIDERQEADFMYAIDACLENGIAITLTDATSDLPIGVSATSWSWTILDAGGTEIGAADGNPIQAILPSEGAYTIRLLSELSNGCEAFTEKDIEVGSDFGLTFSYEVAACAEDDIRIRLFNLSSSVFPNTDITEAVWTVSTGDFSTTTTGVEVYVEIPEMGVYDIEVQTTLANGCSSTIRESVDIEFNPNQLDFEASVGDCNDGTIALELSGQVIDLPSLVSVSGWRWSVSTIIGALTANGMNASIPLPAGGTYVVHLVAELSNGCTVELERSIEVPLENYGVDFTYTLGDCDAGNILLDVSGTIGNLPMPLSVTSWRWLVFNDDVSVSAEGMSASIPIPENGTYTVLLTAVLSDECPAVAYRSVEIELTDTYAIDFEHSVLSCTETDILLQLSGDESALTPPLSVTSWRWEISGNGDMDSAEGAVASVSISGEGMYTVRLITELSNGCPFVIERDIEVAIPTYNVDFDQSVIACDGAQIDLELVGNADGVPNALSVVDWHWEVSSDQTTASGDGETTTLTLPMVGTYDVQLQALMSNGCTAVVQRTIEVVLPDYDIDFTHETTACSEAAILVTLTGDDTGLPSALSVDSWAWMVSGDHGNVSGTGPTTSLTLPGVGAYMVVLTVQLSNGCTTILEREIQVTEPVYSVDFSHAITGCENENILLTLTGDDAQIPSALSVVAWEWTATIDQAEVVGSGMSTTLTLPGEGTYTIELIATLSNGCAAVVEREVQVTEPVYSIDFSHAVTGCENENVLLALTGDDAQIPSALSVVAWEWTATIDQDEVVGNGMSTTLTLPGEGTYTIELIATLSNGCTAVVEREVQVTEPTYSIDFSYVIIGCETMNILLDLTGDDSQIPSVLSVVEWEWTATIDQEEVAGTGMNTTLALPGEGTYTIELIATLSNGCTALIEREVEVEMTEYSLDFDYEIDGCSEEDIVLQLNGDDQDLPAAVSVDTWSWAIEVDTGTIIASGNPAFVLLPGEGNYTITLVAGLSNGCPIEVEQAVSVELYDYQVDFDSNANGCMDVSLLQTFTAEEIDIPSAVSVDTWNWYVQIGDDIQTFSGNPIDIPFPEAGSYVVTLEAVLSNGCTASVSKEITIVEESFVVDFSYQTDGCNEDGLVRLILSEDSPDLPNLIDVVSWDWTIVGNGTTTAEGNNIEVFVEQDSFDVELTVQLSNGCTATFTQEVVTHQGLAADFTFELMGCDNDEIQIALSDVSADLNDQMPVDWIWEFSYDGMTMTMNGEDVVVSVPEGTALSVTLTTIFEDQCRASIQKILPIFINLMADFTYTIDECDQASVDITFTDDSGPNFLGLVPVNWVWVFTHNGQTTTLEGEEVVLSIDSTTQIDVHYTLVFDNGCMAEMEESIVIEFPSIAFFSNPIISCDGQAVSLVTNPNSDWIYNWSPDEGLMFDNPLDQSDPTASPMQATTYQVTVSTGTCEIESEVSVDVRDALNLEIEGDTTSCGEGDIELVVLGGDENTPFEWSTDPDFNVILSTNDTVQVNVSDGSQTFYVRTDDDAVCPGDIDSITVTNEDISEVITGLGELCVGDTITIGIVSIIDDHELDVVWAGNERIIGDLNSSTIQVTAESGDDMISLPYAISNQFGCTKEGTIDLEVGERIILSGVTAMPQDCESLTMCFTSDVEDGDIHWDFGDPSADGDTSRLANPCYTYSAAGIYDVQISATATRCAFEAIVFQIEVPEPINVSVDADTVRYCMDDDVTLTAGSNRTDASILWLDASMMEIGQGPIITITPSGNTTVSAVATTLDGCSDTAVVDLIEYTFDLEVTAPEVHCAGETTQIVVVNNGPDVLTYSWALAECIVSGGDTNMPVVSAVESKDIIGTITNSATNCVTQVVVPIEVVDLNILIVADPDQEINLGESVDLEATGDGNGLDYNWSNGDVGSIITVSPTETTIYTVNVTDENGCTASDQITITVRQPLCNEEDVFLPTAFSPNGDNINDILFVRSNFILEMELLIYDRWGEEVFRSTDIRDGWNGKYGGNGEDLAPDVYAFCLKVTCINEFNYIASGNVTLLR